MSKKRTTPTSGNPPPAVAATLHGRLPKRRIHADLTHLYPEVDRVAPHEGRGRILDSQE